MRLIAAPFLVSLTLLAAEPTKPAFSVKTRSASVPDTVNLRTARVVDLTHTFDEKTIYWPSSPSAFELKVLSHQKVPGGWFYASNSFCTPEHGGTHMDAPIHFAEGKETVDQVPVRELVAPALVIDVAAKAAKDADYRLTAADVAAWESAHGRIPAGAIVLLRTGWGKRWPDRKSYFGSDVPGDVTHLHFPSYGKESAELLVKERRVAGIGIDTASIDYGPSQDFIVHQTAMKENVFGLENLANLDQLPETGAWIVALPMKIGGGSGGPLRAIGLVPQRTSSR
jgi:kynurenine formamidase